MNSLDLARHELMVLSKLLALLDQGCTIRATDPGEPLLHISEDHIDITNLTITRDPLYDECSKENNNGS